MIDLASKECIIWDGKKLNQVYTYDFSGPTEFALAAHLMENPSWKKFNIQFLGKGKIYSINGKTKALKYQPYIYFWKILGEK